MMDADFQCRDAEGAGVLETVLAVFSSPRPCPGTFSAVGA